MLGGNVADLLMTIKDAVLDLRNLILTTDEGSKELLAALEEARQKIADLKLQNDSLAARLNEALAANATQQSQIDAITTKLDQNRATVRNWLVSAVRA